MNFETYEDKMWLPVHTRPRSEKKFQHFCDKYNLLCYLPLRLKIRTKKGYLVKSYLPMFPGYAFALLDDLGKSRLVTSNTVVNFISLTREQEKSLLVDLSGICILEQLQESRQINVSPEIVPGSPVFIKSGPLRGLTGIVEKRKGIHRVIINVEMICQSVIMELDSADLEIIY